jgi:hypothetical protein
VRDIISAAQRQGFVLANGPAADVAGAALGDRGVGAAPALAEGA